MFLTFQSSSQLFTFPMGILTDDYGIVTNEDIEENAKWGSPIDGNGDIDHVWFCIRIDAIESDCEEMYYTEDLGEIGYSDSLRIVSDGDLYEFQTRRTHGHDVCAGYKKTWEELMPLSEVACFSAYYVNEDNPNECDFRKCTNWIIDKVKSKEGSWSYFIEEKSEF